MTLYRSQSIHRLLDLCHEAKSINFFRLASSKAISETNDVSCFLVFLWDRQQNFMCS